MRAAILILVTSIPGVVFAQDGSTSTIAETPAVVEQAKPAQPKPPNPAPQPPKPPAQPPQPPPPPTPIRRGTMVGYIDDATIETYMRVRFDTAFDNDVPDRTEFFYAQCGCNGGGAPGPGITGAQDLATSVNFQQLFADFSYAFHPRLAAFGSLPLRFVQPQSFLGETLSPPQNDNTFDSGSGLSDIRAGVKGSIYSTDTSVVTAQIQFYFPSGDATKGLGTDHTSFEAALLFHQRVSDRLTIESQFGDWHPIGGSTANGADYAGDVLFYGIGPSYELVNTGRLRIAPVVELVGWHVLGGLQQPGPPAGAVVPAEGTNIVNLKLGARTSFNEMSSFYVGYGFAMTDAQWYGKIVRFEYRYSF
ncbi:MAG TPA: hypothetical protein VJM31_06385 [Vicinamibacterales bacterium]|nr:hypothetical protein [Vicinamibacterales bacterium]